MHPCVTPLVFLVFDTCNVHNDRAFGLDFHLDRLLRSAATARIEHNTTKEALRDIILATIAAGGRNKGDASARYWLSAGRCVCGNSQISKLHKYYCNIEPSPWVSIIVQIVNHLSLRPNGGGSADVGFRVAFRVAEHDDSVGREKAPVMGELRRLSRFLVVVMRCILLAGGVCRRRVYTAVSKATICSLIAQSC